ncbi:hypothetical protein LTR66_014647 [Elasticomyces elasticus]|nr:hypothetical protein LTR66_014647 [Elasticomyces elasticus]
MPHPTLSTSSPPTSASSLHARPSNRSLTSSLDSISATNTQPRQSRLFSPPSTTRDSSPADLNLHSSASNRLADHHRVPSLNWLRGRARSRQDNVAESLPTRSADRLAETRAAPAAEDTETAPPDQTQAAEHPVAGQQLELQLPGDAGEEGLSGTTTGDSQRDSALEPEGAGDPRDWVRSSEDESVQSYRARTGHGLKQKMHQTSSRLLRMTDDDRPFTRDFKDLFSTLMVSLPLTPHRVRFQRIEHTFTTEEAITNLGSLKFSQSNRMPDPKDPSRIVTTTTTTTFSMAKEMARSVCTRFLEARFVESVDGKHDFTSKNSVWQLTPKGMHILSGFCQRNGINQRHVNELLDSPRNVMQLVILERETDTDKLNHDRATVEVLFRRFVGQTDPNLKTNSATSDSESLHEYATGQVGVKMNKSRKTAEGVQYSFTGKAAVDWLMDCCTVVDRRECFELANLFIQAGLIIPLTDDRGQNHPNPAAHRFQASKHALYAVTEQGQRVAGWTTTPNGSVSSDSGNRTMLGLARDSNTNRMTVIIRDPALRLLFGEFLRETHCEENLAFYLDVRSFLKDYENAKRAAPTPRLDVIRETLASAYSLYNAFLAPGSPCELNIDHSLRNALAGRMTRAVGEDEAMVKSLDEVAVLFDQAQNSVFKLMASDSVPKFARDPKYCSMLRDRNLDQVVQSMASTSIS